MHYYEGKIRTCFIIPYLFFEGEQKMSKTRYRKSVVERNFQAALIKEIKKRFPGCLILKNDPNYIQGIPDLIILWKKHWAALEVKKSSTARHRPNQDYYISKMKEMSFASFIFPENKEDVLNEIQRSFEL